MKFKHLNFLNDGVGEKDLLRLFSQTGCPGCSDLYNNSGTADTKDDGCMPYGVC